MMRKARGLRGRKVYHVLIKIWSDDSKKLVSYNERILAVCRTLKNTWSKKIVHRVSVKTQGKTCGSNDRIACEEFSSGIEVKT